MRHWLLLSCFYMLALGAAAQGASRFVEISHYLLPDFQQGRVLMKGGQMKAARLNYNAATEEMIFLQSGHPAAVDRTAYVDTVYIGSRRFVPGTKGFYEVLTTTPIPLLVQYKCLVTKPSGATGYGTAGPAASTTRPTDLYQQGILYDLNLPTRYKVRTEEVFWLQKKGQLFRISNSRQVAAVFPDQARAIP